MARALTDEQYGILDPHHGDYSNMTNEILSEEALQILRENDLNYLFDELLTEICIQKPRQPKLFISGWFKRRLRNPFGDYLASPKLHHSTSCPVTQEDLTNAHSPLKSTSTTTAQQEQISLSASPMLKSAGSMACLTPQLEDVKVQRAARKRTVTMLKTQKSSSPPPAVATPPSQGNGSFGNSERVVSIGTSSCARLGMLTESLQASAAVNNDGSSSVRSLSASDGQLNILGISGSRTIDIPDVTPLLRNAVSPVMGRIIYVEHAVEEQCDDPDHVAPPVDEDSGACHCDMGTITKDYRGSDFSSFHCHTLFNSCKICSRHPADRLCMCCLDAFCFKHSRMHYKDDTHHSLFMNHEYIAVNYKKAFYCAACNTYTWAYVDAYEPLGDQVVVTKGTYLSHPSQDKYFRKLDVDGVVSVLGVSMQGWRSGQEDAECLLHLMDDIYLFSVFDGHGGGDVARMVAKILPEIIRKYIVENSYVQDGRNAEVMKSLLMVAFRECDEELITTTQGSDGEFNTIGCTATCVIYDHISEEIICANLGDSRATVGMLNPSLDTDLSFDHKLYNEVEEARVTAAGYKIIDGRVEGMLAVPRAFGDFDFKQSGGLSAAHQAVTCIPEITSMNRKLEGVQFLVIACDGIWDAASSKQVRDFIRRKSSECTMEQTLGMLLDRCCSSNITEDGVGTDNMSVVVVQFL